MADDFHDIADTICSPSEYAMRAAAGAWTALAGAASQSQGRLRTIAEDTAAEPGVGLLDLADRLDTVGGWGAGAGAVAAGIAQQLQTAAEATAKAVERALHLEERYEESHRLHRETAAADVTTAASMHAQRMQKLKDEARDELDALSAVYATVTGGTAPSAPEVGSAGLGGGPTGRAAPAGGHGGEDARPAAYVTTASGGRIGVGEYPYSSVVGPEGGDFAGWVRSPGTGFLVDPATGREFDTVTGRWIDPVTGRPFGDVTEYATRLAGLGGGPGPLAGPGGVGVAPAGAGGVVGTPSAFAGLYGGTVPPSVAHSGPAQQQVARQASRSLAERARVADRYAAREAAQGGRPYVPPPGAGGQRPAQGGRSGAPTGGGRRAAPGEPAATWRGRAADAAARHRLAGPPPAPAAARTAPGQGRERRRAPGPGLTEDASVWRPAGPATPGVLGQ
ncbi:hypothetical protein V1J52_00810 [Streptomyces sp. TRM 70351]|uniref:hypothetical protein n=1 Tax=Streptomyces sp. TRM 70351 TaxID=3116552 RepID=UPI002E7BA239|nr:hypothetical protein [Streptomyces sp. TRM 70351]MEE1926734.1 hypothetical protein [Streptomyces sp. TRM 70351]